MSDEQTDNQVLKEQAQAVLLKERRVSISLLQRHLRLGYSRTVALLDELEKEGVVTGPNDHGQRAFHPVFIQRFPELETNNFPELPKKAVCMYFNFFKR